MKADQCALLMEICLAPMPLESLRSSRRYATLYVIDAGTNEKPLYDFLLVTIIVTYSVPSTFGLLSWNFVAIAPKRRELGKGLLLITNRNSYMGFPLVPRSAAYRTLVEVTVQHWYRRRQAWLVFPSVSVWMSGMTCLILQVSAPGLHRLLACDLVQNLVYLVQLHHCTKARYAYAYEKCTL